MRHDRRHRRSEPLHTAVTAARGVSLAVPGIRAPRRAAGWAYRKAASPLGLRVIARAPDAALPEWLRPPLRVLLGAPTPQAARQLAARVERQRAAHMRRGDVYR